MVQEIVASHQDGTTAYLRLIDPVPLHVEQAREAGERCGSRLDRCMVGDARRVECPDEWADTVLLFGPLYHLVERQDRLEALREVRRVLRSGGVVFAVGISRFASVLDGMRKGYLADAGFRRIVEQDLLDGQHRNPAGHPAYFTTAFFHHPDELEREIRDSGLELDRLFAVEGPAWLITSLEEQWNDPDRREPTIHALRNLEGERSILGASAHIMAIAHKVMT